MFMIIRLNEQKFANKKLRIVKEKELKNIFEKLKNSRTFPCSNAKLFIENK